jgi:hypothetical protein
MPRFASRAGGAADRGRGALTEGEEMQAEARRRWIAGAIAGAERLCLPLPWERGGRRERMLHRRRAAAAARQRPVELIGTARSDRTAAGATPLAGPQSRPGSGSGSGSGAGSGSASDMDDFLTD